MPSSTVTTTASKVVEANEKRFSIIFYNNSDETIYLLGDSSVTVDNGIPLAKKTYLTESKDGSQMYMADYWAIASSGPLDLRYWERTQW